MIAKNRSIKIIAHIAIFSIKTLAKPLPAIIAHKHNLIANVVRILLICKYFARKCEMDL